jgi:hypothetical protein
MKQIALFFFLITLSFATQLSAQSTDSLLAEQGERFIISKTVQLWSLLHSYYMVNGKIPENMEQLKDYSNNSTIIFDTSFVTNYRSLDSATVAFDFSYASDKGQFINDTLTILSLSAKISGLSIENFAHIVGDYYMDLFGKIQAAKFLIANKSFKLNNSDFQTIISSAYHLPRVRYIKIDNKYPEDSPEYLTVISLEKIRNNQLQQFFELFDPHQMDTVKNVFRKMFTGDFSDSVRMATFGVKTVQEYNLLSGAKVLYNLLGKYFGVLGDCFLFGNDGCKVLGCVPDGDVFRVMVKTKFKADGKVFEKVENYEVVKVNGKYCMRFPIEFELGLDDVLNSFKPEQAH